MMFGFLVGVPNTHLRGKRPCNRGVLRQNCWKLAIRNWLRVKKLDQLVLECKRAEMIPSRVVMSDEVLREILFHANPVLFEVL